MNIRSCIQLVIGVVSIVLAAGTLRAQVSPEDQAKAILQLFEAGQKDTAYALIEPLKKSARFVPAVLYVRAQMTQDDRALGLYKELIALEPESEWAEKSAYQLVARYTDKRDSLAAYTWNKVLKDNYAKSDYVVLAETMLAGVSSWRSADEGTDVAAQRPKPAGRETRPGAGTKPAASVATRDSTAKPAASTKPAAGTKPATSKPGTAKPTASTSGTTSTGTTKPVAGKAPAGTAPATGTKPPTTGTSAKAPTANEGAAADAPMRGFALQVGLFPTRAKAEARAAELKAKNVIAQPLPKYVDGKKNYALIVGPYATMEEANKKKAAVSKGCDCQAFLVDVH